MTTASCKLSVATILVSGILCCGVTTQSAPVQRDSGAASTPGRFGVMIGGNMPEPQIPKAVTQLGASWVRLNCHMDGQQYNFRQYLDAGIDLVITFNNADPSNIDTSHGGVRQWGHAGFPFRTKAAYQERVRETLTPLLPYLARGRQIWVQCENEISDASVNPKSLYWRGTTDQYLAQLRAFCEAARSLNPSVPVILTSFASRALDAVASASDPRHRLAERLLIKLLNEGSYDVVDLHLYGCVEEIPAKVQWVRSHMPAGKRWISTESGGPDYRCPATPIHWEQDRVQFELLQAQQVSARLKAAADTGASLCLWFSLFDLRNESGVFSHMGLLDPSTMPPRRKPAYEAFKSFVAIQPRSL